MQPILIRDAAAASPAPKSQGASSGGSRARVACVVGDRPHFSDETAGLIRSRLTAAAWLIVAVLGAAFVGYFFTDTATLWWLRGLLLLVVLGAAVRLQRPAPLSLRQLRLLELVVFGSVLVQLSVMLLVRLDGFAARQDAVSLASARQQVLAAWCVLIFIYGTLMPNAWKRGAAVMLTAAVVPYVLVALQSWLSPQVGALLAADHAITPLPLPVLAALVATFATHVINAARREAFQARQFGQYRLLEKIGAGGMGEVYRAEHVLLKRPCAIKLIQAACEADAATIARFEKEVQTTARLTHWNTIEIYDYGRTDDGTFYYVMELLPGMSLEELVERYGPTPPERVIHLLRQICGALHEAHSVGLIHRDIKPANIFASQRGAVYDVAKLLDFGLVKQRYDPTEPGAQSGAFSGTPLFMSPEQAAAYDDVDGRADIYSLGVVAYYLLTGKTPFTERNVLQLLAAHRNAVAAPPSSMNPAIGPDLEAVVLKCMAKRPADRFADAEELRKALDGCSASQLWGSEQAAAWWQTRETLPAAPAEAPPLLAATIDSQPAEA